MPIIEQPYPLAVGSLGFGDAKFATAIYDFAALGGAVGSVNLTGFTLPLGAIITDSLILVDTIVAAGAGATIALNAESAGDIQTAAIFSGAPWSTTGPKHGTLTASSAPVKTTAIRPIVATIAVAALTAGKFRVSVTYVEAP